MHSFNIGDAGEKLRRSTVQVELAGSGGGSGVVLSSTGHIVTNAHVVRGRNAQVTLWDGRRFPALLQAVARKHDLALLKIGTLGLPAAKLGDSASVKPGQLVLAVGNPLGFVGAISTGVIHTVGPLYGAGSNNWVQADVRLAPGNSGGPLTDAKGDVIGINTMIAHGLALAIPSNVVRDFLRLARREAA